MESPTQLNDMRTPPPAPETSGKGMSPIALIVIVVILLIVGAWFMLSKRDTTVTYDDHGNPITHVAPGSVVETFPQRFLVEEGVTVAESYTIDYANVGNFLSTARYTSAMSLEDNINAFGEIFVTEEWMVTVEPDYEATGTTNFYAIKGNEHINVVFVPGEAGVEVIISHSLQG